MTTTGKRVSFNDRVTVLCIPGRDEEQMSTPRQWAVAEILRFAVKTMNILDNNIVEARRTLQDGEDDVIHRMAISDHTGKIAQVLVGHPSIKYIKCNISLKGVKYDDANLRDKIALDFLNSIEDGVNSMGDPDEDPSTYNTLHLLMNPRPDDMIRNMEHCLVLRTTRFRQMNLPAFHLIMDVNMDV